MTAGGLNGDAAEPGRGTVRRELDRALRPAAAADRLAELERKLLGLSRPAPAAAAPAPAPPAPPAPAGELPPEARELIDLATAPPEPSPSPGAPPLRRPLLREEASAAELRKRVAEARRTLHDMDLRVTTLTRDLREGRRDLWLQQQRKSAAEAGLSAALAARESELSPRGLEEKRRLNDEARLLRQGLVDAKQRAARWYTEAQRHEGMVQQERDAMRGGPHPILAKHPAGEVFLVSADPDNDSDDSRSPRGPPRRGSDSSDSEDEAYGARPASAGARPGVARIGLGGAADSGDSEEDVAEASSASGSSLPTPSGASGSFSGAKVEDADAPSRGPTPTGGTAPSAPLPADSASSDGSSAEDAEPHSSRVAGAQVTAALESWAGDAGAAPQVVGSLGGGVSSDEDSAEEAPARPAAAEAPPAEAAAAQPAAEPLRSSRALGFETDSSDEKSEDEKPKATQPKAQPSAAPTRPTGAADQDDDDASSYSGDEFVEESLEESRSV